jgi:beta-glucanase (GH16 family)
MQQAIRLAAVAVMFMMEGLAACGNPGGQNAKWALSWSDEFNGPSGSAPDPAKWVYDIGGNGWGNKELEYYTDSRKNSYADGGGNLVIKAIKEEFKGSQYTTARLKTQGKFSQAHGKFEARMKLPFGQGIWPAFWMLGDDITTVGWPACGEIDIMEHIGKEPSTIHGTAHGPGYSGGEAIGKAIEIPDGKKASDAFHVFTIEWEPQQIRWYMDGKLYHTLTPSNLPAGKKWVFDHPHFLILNLAVGGQWPGYPDQTTTFPQTMLVDYVRVYRAQR